MVDTTKNVKKSYFKSKDELLKTPDFLKRSLNEFSGGLEDRVVPDSPERRRFLGILGASMAFAGMGATSCVRKPKEAIVAYNKRPEYLVPGKANYFATSLYVAGGVTGLLVESHEGRPTKIEGNSLHSANNPLNKEKVGVTNTFTQAEILRMYDVERSQTIRQGKSVKSKDQLVSFLKTSLDALEGNELSIITPEIPSPTYAALLGEIVAKYNNVRVYSADDALVTSQRRALGALGYQNASAVSHFDKADLVVAANSDFLGLDPDSVRNAQGFAAKRKVSRTADTMSRFIAVESHYTITGQNADNRLRLAASQMDAFLAEVAKELSRSGVTLPVSVPSDLSLSSERELKFAKTVAKELVANQGRSVLSVGKRESVWAQILGFAINSALGNVGTTVEIFERPDLFSALPLEEFVKSANAGSVGVALVIDANPAFTAPTDVGFVAAFEKVGATVHLGYYHDETAKLAGWHVPLTHGLEAWGDFTASDGTHSIRQPLIAPLYDECVNEIQFLGFVLNGSAKASTYETVKKYWEAKVGSEGFVSRWQKWLHDGVISSDLSVSTSSKEADYTSFTAVSPRKGAAPSGSSYEVVFALDNTLFDGRYANNSWLQELSDPISKLTWDNAAIMSPSTALVLGVKDGDLVTVSVNGKKLDIAAFVVPGVATNSVVIPIGYGTKLGTVSNEGQGFNAQGLRSSKSPGFAVGATIKKAGGTYELATTQDVGGLHQVKMGSAKEELDRRIPTLVRENTLEGYKKDPYFIVRSEPLSQKKQDAMINLRQEQGRTQGKGIQDYKAYDTFLWTNPLDEHRKETFETGKRKYQQWGMTIDLNLCTGCSACTIACQAENNIPVVGKKEVLNGREMSWIRIDRYFSADVDNPDGLSEKATAAAMDDADVISQPLGCAHCETAPCESVCPVSATVHSKEGLNDMAYNRCIGTRFCANNCPFKVRRFNYFNFQKETEQSNPLIAMQRNPNVTVRFRGVIEKCTYCVQRINTAKVDAKLNKNTHLVDDGAIQVACQQACPTSAIEFGDIDDPKTAVAKAKAQERNYGLLSNFNLKPRTTYLAKLRNPNPELTK